MFPIINIGPIAIQAAGLLFIISLWIGFWLTSRFAASLGTNGEVIENSLLLGLLAGIISARVGFLLVNFSNFLENPLSLFSLSLTTLNTSFGILVGVLVIWIIAHKNHLPLWPTLDTIVPLVIFIFIGIQLVQLANGTNFGLSTSAPWGISLWEETRHPVQIYALILVILLFVALNLKTKLWRTTGFFRNGLLFWATIAGLSFITLFTRAFIFEKNLLLGIDSRQLLSFILLIASLLLFYNKFFKKRNHIGVVISVGSNLNPKENLHAAIEKIKSEFKVRRTSKIFITKDVKGDENTKDFLNMVIEIETSLSYVDLNHQLKAIEQDLGRIPGNKTEVAIDLDIITYNGDVFSVDSKVIPDPNLTKYRYIAEPLAQMDPDFIHPGSGKSINHILAEITKTKAVNRREVANEIKK